MTLVPTAVTAAPCLVAPPLLALSRTCTTTLSKTRAASTVTVNSLQQLGALLKEQTELAASTQDQWVCSPTASWIRELLAELTPEQRADLHARRRTLETMASADFSGRWELASGFAQAILRHWLSAATLEQVSKLNAAHAPTRAPAKDAIQTLILTLALAYHFALALALGPSPSPSPFTLTLTLHPSPSPSSSTQVLAKAESFGHTGLKSGVVLTGAAVRAMATGQTVSVPELMPWVRALSTKAVEGTEAPPMPASGGGGATGGGETGGGETGGGANDNGGANVALFRVRADNHFHTEDG